MLDVIVVVKEIVPYAAKFQILPLAAETPFYVETQETVEHGKAGIGAVLILIMSCVGSVVPLLALSDGTVVIVALQQIEAVDVEIGCGVNLEVDVEHKITEVAGTFSSCAIVVAAGGVCSISEGGIAAAVAFPVAVTARHMYVKLQPITVAHVAYPWREIRSRVAAQAYQPQLAGAQLGRGDNIEDMLALFHHILC